MSEALSRTLVTTVLKEQFPDGRLDPVWMYREHPFLGSLGRRKDMQGRAYVVPVQTSLQNGSSHDVALATSLNAASRFQAFSVPPITNYARANFQGIAMRQAREDKQGAAMWLNTVKNEFEGAFSTLGNAQAKEAVGDVGGSIAQIGTLVSATRIQLKYPELMVFFSNLMYLQFSANDGTASGHALRASGAIAQITSINEAMGYLDFNNASYPLSGITSLAATDYMFIKGNFKAAAYGLRSWVPATDPQVGDAAFLGVDRSQSVNVLSGVRYDGSADTMESVFIRAKTLFNRFGKRSGVFYINPTDYERIALTKEGLKEPLANSYNMGFETITIGTSKFVLDYDITPGEAWYLDPTDFVYCTNGDQPKIDDYDDLTFIRQSDDSYRVDFVIDYCFFAPAPGRIGRVTLPARGVLS